MYLTVLKYTFLVISFDQYKVEVTCLILFSKFSNGLSAFTEAVTIGKLWSICFGINILISLSLFILVDVNKGVSISPKLLFNDILFGISELFGSGEI